MTARIIVEPNNPEAIIMKAFRLLLYGSLIATIMVASSSLAAPVESVESARASLALQKLDAFLSEQVVTDQLTALGLTKEQVCARLSQCSQAQLEELAAQVDLLQAGGTIESGQDPVSHTIKCIFQPLGRLLYNIYQVLFCWGDLE